MPGEHVQELRQVSTVTGMRLQEPLLTDTIAFADPMTTGIGPTVLDGFETLAQSMCKSFPISLTLKYVFVLRV